MKYENPFEVDCFGNIILMKLLKESIYFCVL